jgi:hypothetical protein
MKNPTSKLTRRVMMIPRKTLLLAIAAIKRAPSKLGSDSYFSPPLVQDPLHARE